MYTTISRSDKSDFSENIKILQVNNSSSQHAYNRTKDILILVKSPTDGLNDTETIAEAGYSIHFSEQQNKFFLNFACSGSSSYLFVNGVKIYRFDTKDSEIKTYGLCLGNILKDFTIDSMKAFIKCASIKNQQCMVKPMLIATGLETTTT